MYCIQSRASINYNSDTGLDVVFDLFPGRVFTITPHLVRYLVLNRAPAKNVHKVCKM